MNKLKSRKFWVAVAGVLLPTLAAVAGLNLSATIIAGNAAIASAYILGEAAVDFANACIKVAGELKIAIDDSLEQVLPNRG